MNSNFRSYLKAGYPILYCQTSEEDRAIANFSRESNGYLCASWDCVTGIKDLQNDQIQQISSPLKALQFVTSMKESSILFLKDFHKWIENTEIFRTLKNLKSWLEANDVHIVIISPVLKIPTELEKDIYLIDLELPTAEELMKIAEWALNQARESNPEIQFPEIDESVIRNSVGLTSDEAKNVFSRSLVESRAFDPSIIQTEKMQTVKKSNLAELENPVPENELGGLGRLAKYLHQRLIGFIDPKIPKRAKPRGVLFVGPPGTGKSLAGKVTASIFKLPMLKCNPSTLKGGIVGATEQNTKNFWKMARSLAPCVVFIDEIEKAFGGVQSSNRTDGGTGAASFGIFLTEMQDAADSGLGIYFVATCNEIEDLLAISQGALLRRFDDIFFVDLPNVTEKKHILKIMNKRYGTNHPEELTERMINWTGAEIEKFVIASLYETIETAFQNIKPVFIQNQNRIESARKWAKENARLANTEETNGTAEKKERRMKI